MGAMGPRVGEGRAASGALAGAGPAAAAWAARASSGRAMGASAGASPGRGRPSALAGPGRGPALCRAVGARPAGVTEPSVSPKKKEASVGFCDFAEQLNGRACMVGFVAMFLVEGAYGFFNPHGGLFQLLGITVGNGLGFEF